MQAVLLMIASSAKPYSTLTDFNQLSREVLFPIYENRQVLRELVLAVPESDSLLASCAHYEAVDKIVLWNSVDQNLQLRLHIYANQANRSLESSQIDIAMAHNHRWNFSSLILSGGYHHTIYRIDQNEEASSIPQLIPVMLRQESAGCFYTLHHSQYHSVIEEPNTVSLILRGKVEKERFQVVSEEEEGLKWQEGSLLEGKEEKNQKQMSHKKYTALVDKLVKLGVID